MLQFKIHVYTHREFESSIRRAWNDNEDHCNLISMGWTYRKMEFRFDDVRHLPAIVGLNKNYSLSDEDAFQYLYTGYSPTLLINDTVYSDLRAHIPKVEAFALLSKVVKVLPPFALAYGNYELDGFRCKTYLNAPCAIIGYIQSHRNKQKEEGSFFDHVFAEKKTSILSFELAEKNNGFMDFPRNYAKMVIGDLGTR